ncbi:FAD-dependent oxidoreductase [Pseudomonas mangiferae]|uniref:Rieske 2Fe-2S domain-containing protein n=1 Tax=Pseudomonas mangiferae TaxID=2593654 RepID=A0A553GXG9_9PSED|nr:FAD-dependent oxidoreductase [Pseudomonas mangiferae]TRX74191.1 Rieske 2Fe-2S domain-containing protein [Pseudomonas mangiferae]
MADFARVATLSELPQDRGTRVEVDGEPILLVRDGMKVQALQATCPHAGAPLEQGAVCAGRLICPWHKANFRIQDGALCEPPALDALRRYPVRVEKGEVYVSARPLQAPADEPVGDDDRVFLVIGAGAAGTAAVTALRDNGFPGRVLLVGDEPSAPYDRTALSKFVLAGDMPPDEVPPLRPADWWARQRIERVVARVTHLDARARQATLADGRVLDYDAAFLASGGEAQPLEVPGHDLPGVHLLRSREQAAAILADVRPEGRAVVVGNGFIGLEAASALRKAGMAVHVVAPHGTPFAKQFGERLGRMFRALHEDNGVVFHSTEVAQVDGEDRVHGVTLKDGTRLAADLVVVGVGVKPATDFVEGVEKEKDGGLRLDDRLRAADGLWAGGDIARYPQDGQWLRVEHWRLAQQHGRLAAANMLGADQAFEAVPFFWTYHFGKRFEYLGHAEDWDEERIEGHLDQHRFIALLVKAGQVQAVVACQRERATARLLEALGEPLDVERAWHLVREAERE